MEVKAKYNPKPVLSPQPKRSHPTSQFNQITDLARSQSCELNSDEVLFELSSILSTSAINDNSVLSLQFSNTFRSKTNPIIFDEKFVQLEYSLSTSEDSGSDSDRILESV